MIKKLFYLTHIFIYQRKYNGSKKSLKNPERFNHVYFDVATTVVNEDSDPTIISILGLTTEEELVQMTDLMRQAGLWRILFGTDSLTVGTTESGSVEFNQLKFTESEKKTILKKRHENTVFKGIGVHGPSLSYLESIGIE